MLSNCMIQVLRSTYSYFLATPPNIKNSNTENYNIQLTVTDENRPKKNYQHSNMRETRGAAEHGRLKSD